MPHWILTPPPPGRKMKGLMGPYTSFRAQRIADKLDTPYEIVQTVSDNKLRAKREMKEKLIQEEGYETGTRNIRKPVKVIDEEDEY